MDSEFLSERRKGLEDSFFAKHNQDLLEKLKERQQIDEKKALLASASGISNDAVLTALIGLDIEAETLAAFALYPLVAVAWADGKIADSERSAVLSGAEQAGITKDGLSYQLLASWFADKPGSDMTDAWKAYAAAMVKSLSTEDQGLVKKDILERARHVAEAAGGFLGLGNKVSEQEIQVLGELESALS